MAEPTQQHETSRGPGRPSVADERRTAIIDAYIELVVENGTPDVTIGNIATRAGVARTAISHFVGDRDDLRITTIEVLGRRYESTVRSVIGLDPSPHEVVDYFFSPAWSTGRSTDDRAFDILQATAPRNPTTRHAVRNAYAALIDAFAASLERHTAADADRCRGIAYSIVCLVETNTVLQDLGFSDHDRTSAADAAHALVDAVG
ncbi:MAG: TetR/AcrR family transcriptional regulator [Actinomycetota bacterium]